MLDENLKKAIAEKRQKEKDDFARHIHDFWGDNVSIVEWIDHAEAPFHVFEMRIVLYNKNEVLLAYQKGGFAISVKVDDSFQYLDNLTDKSVVYGFDSMRPENIVSNFKALDETVKAMNGSPS